MCCREREIQLRVAANKNKRGEEKEPTHTHTSSAFRQFVTTITLYLFYTASDARVCDDDAIVHWEIFSSSTQKGRANYQGKEKDEDFFFLHN